MSEFLVRGVPGSPYVRCVVMGLEEKHANWRLVPLQLGEQKAPEYLRKHPFARIPVIEHGDFVLYESQAILRYLDRILPEPPLTPRDEHDEARMNQICGIVDWYVFKDISAGICFPRLVAPHFGLPVDEARIAASLAGAEVCVRELARLLGDREFMAGDSLTLADLMLAPHLAFFGDAQEGVKILGEFPNLLVWIARMKARPSMVVTEWGALAQHVKVA